VKMPHIESIQNKLSSKWKDTQIVLFETIDSTNSEAKRRLRKLVSGKTLLIAKTQTGGRGRLGRSFYSPKESGIYMTLVYSTTKPLAQVVSITSAAAVAVMEAIKETTGKQTVIKWVNDLYYQKKKICGILAETMPDSLQNNCTYVILGIGINLNTEEFPSELESIAGSLQSDCDPNQLIANITNKIFDFSENQQEYAYMDRYRSASMVLGKQVICAQGDKTFLGTAADITDNGALVVLLQDGNEILLDSGEVTLRMI